MARNRKRAKERRTRRPATGPASRPGVATARADRDRREAENGALDPEIESSPGPIDHAAPDVELAEAQLARRRPTPPGAEEDEDFETDEASARELAPSAETAVAPRAGLAHRLIAFLQGSWRELQRVQWPDRRQVMQATGVVVGFVIVAGLYLGLADTVASRLVNLILK